MNFIDLGLWGAPTKETDGESGMVYAKYTNSNGEDWYNTVAHNPDRPLGFSIALIDDGSVQFSAEDVSGMEPGNKRVIVFPGKTSADFDMSTLFKKIFDLTTGELVDPPATVPVSVTKAQAQIALFNAGLLDNVETIVENHPYRPVKIWYTSANNWERANPYVQAIGVELGLSVEEIDDLFIAASLLV